MRSPRGEPHNDNDLFLGGPAVPWFVNVYIHLLGSLCCCSLCSQPKYTWHLRLYYRPIIINIARRSLHRFDWMRRNSSMVGYYPWYSWYRRVRVNQLRSTGLHTWHMRVISVWSTRQYGNVLACRDKVSCRGPAWLCVAKTCHLVCVNIDLDNAGCKFYLKA